MSFWIDILSTIVSPILEKHLATLRESREIKKFNKILIDLSEEYIREHETEAVAHSEFADYLKRSNIFENMFDFIENPNNISEKEFIAEKSDAANKYVNEYHPIDITDKSVYGYIYIIFQSIKKFYKDKLSDGETYLVYTLMQAIETKHSFLLEILKPLVEKFHKDLQQPEPIKQTYPFDETLIKRTISTLPKCQKAIFDDVSTKVGDLINFCLECKTVVLLGEAGCGKSKELEQLAGILSYTRPTLFPLLYKLDGYVDESISEILKPYNYDQVSQNELFLIFDGFDEIQNKHKNNFARRITDFAKTHPETHIVISSRTNFYRFANIDKQTALFKGFEEIYLTPLSHKDIDNYVLENGIAPAVFWKEVSDKALESMVCNPFYMKFLINFLKESGNLPLKTELMDEIIKNRFREDSSKYISTTDVDLNAKKQKIISSLCKVAFSMQCMQIKEVDISICSEFLDDNSIELFEFSGIFAKKANQLWAFEHNNFREYLTAKFLISLSLEEINSLIFDANNKVKASWLNVLSFLIWIYPNDSLLNIISEKDTEAYIKFEPARLSDKDRTEIFRNIFNSCSERNVWISRTGIQIEDYARFGQTKESCLFLLSHINIHDSHFRRLSNALHTISFFKECFSLETEIRSALFGVIKDPDVREYEKKEAVAAITNLNLESDEISAFLLSDIPDKCTVYSGEILQYFTAIEKHEENVQIFLNQFKAAHSHTNYGYEGSISYYAKKAIKQLRSAESVSKAIIFITSIEHLYSSEDEVFDYLFAQAETLYSNGETQMVDIIFKCYKIAEKRYEHKLLTRCKTFFINTNTIIAVFEKFLNKYLESKDYKDLFILEDFATDDCVSHLRTLCNEKKDIYLEPLEKITIRLPKDSTSYIENARFLEAKGVALPEPRVPIDYEGERKKGTQIYFDSLFNKNNYHELVLKLLEYIEDPDVTFEDFEKKVSTRDFEDRALGQALWYVSFDMEDLKKAKSKNIKVADWSSIIKDWSWYSMCQIQDVLTRRDSVEISKEQNQYITNYCYRCIEDIDFVEEIKDHDNGGVGCSPRLHLVSSLSAILKIPYRKELFYKLMLVPPFIMDHNTKSYHKFSEYITDNLTIEEIKNAVKNNISSNRMCFDAAETHLEFCIEHKMDCGVELAKSLVSNKIASEFTKRKALEYLLEFKDIDFIYEHYLDTEDTTIFKCVVDVTANKKHPLLKRKLESIAQNSENPTEHLSLLISMNSRIGLSIYYQEAKTRMQVLDGLDENNYSHLTESISAISEIDLLPELSLLQELLFTEGFEDRRHFNLHNALYRALENIAKNNYEKVCDYIKEKAENPTISMDEKAFCNALLDDIQQTYALSVDKPWDIPQTVTFIRTANFIYH